MSAIEPRVDVAPFEHAGRKPAAVYERELEASVERIWENVLDWEHLPFLHPQAFTSVKKTAASPDSWHGEVGIPGGLAEVDVKIDLEGLRYSTRTVAGFGAGSEIVTTLFPRDPRRTGIRVDFHLPWAPAGAEESIGQVYRDLYIGLWDQDEQMMRERQRVLDAAATPRAERAETHVDLGSVRELAARLPLHVQLAGRTYRVVSVDGQLYAHDVVCPHLGGPLGERPLEGCEAVCPWHGYRFDVRSGESTEGRGLRLRRPAVVHVSACDGQVTLRLP